MNYNGPYYSTVTVKKVYTMNADGSNIKFIGYGDKAQFSSDGSKIYFGNLNVINIDGTGLRRLVPQNISVWDYSISDDGKLIVLTTFYDLYIMRSDGTGLINLLSNNGPDDYFTSPCISPNDSLIIFEHKRKLSFINPDGSNLKTLFTADSSDQSFIPAFAENGSKLLFVRSSNNSSAYIEYYNISPPYGLSIYVYQGPTDMLDGFQLIRGSNKDFAIFTGSKNYFVQSLYIHKINLITLKDTSLAYGFDASLSKDCTKIIYTKPNDSNKAIYIYDLNNAGEISTIKTNFNWAVIQHPKFSPNGNLILFEADSTYQVKADNQ